MVISKNKYQFSVLTAVYNEAKNIEKFINTVKKQKLSKNIILKEMLIVASGCTDDSVKIIKNQIKKDKQIRLIVQKEREGKAVAVNILLANAKTELLILQSADTLPYSNCYNLLLKELVKSGVGLTAGRIMPQDDKNTFIGYANHFKWSLHHKINLKYPQRPKVGELIAFKKIFMQIPSKTAVDEASIEPLIHLQGYRIKYVPKAIIYNSGPKTIREYLSQRRRIYAGHYVTRQKYAYEIVTFSGLRILPIFLKEIIKKPERISYSLLIASMELIARIFGFIDVKFKLRSHTVWKISKTSKKMPL